MIVEPLESGVGDDIEMRRLNLSMGVDAIANLLEHNHGWDALASRNVWAFGPTDCSPNILLNDTLVTQVRQ